MLAMRSAPFGPSFSAWPASSAPIGAATCSGRCAALLCGSSIGIRSLLWLRLGHLNRRGDLLIIGGDGGDLLIVQLLCLHRHLIGAVLTVASLPFAQRERSVVSVLSFQVWNRRPLPSTSRSVTVITALDLPLGIADGGEGLAGLHERSLRLLEWQGRRVRARVVGCDVCHILGT